MEKERRFALLKRRKIPETESAVRLKEVVVFSLGQRAHEGVREHAQRPRSRLRQAARNLKLDIKHVIGTWGNGFSG
jgi:hypothetical protein